jgi:hypothetical protein
MTNYRSDRKHDLLTGWVFPVLAWTIAWGVMGVSLYISGVFNSPRTGPLWVALAGGAIAWSVAGAITFPAVMHQSADRRNIAGFVIWALAFLMSFALTGLLVSALDDTLSTFFMMFLGWSMGPGVGAFVSTWLLTDHPSLRRSCIFSGIWILGFFVGSWFGLVAIYLGPELAKIYLGSLIGEAAALTLGFGLGSAAGGLVASAIAVTLTRLITRFL